MDKPLGPSTASPRSKTGGNAAVSAVSALRKGRRLSHGVGEERNQPMSGRATFAPAATPVDLIAQVSADAELQPGSSGRTIYEGNA